MLDAQSTTKDYIRAAGDIHKEIVVRTNRAEKNKTGRLECEIGELLGEFTERNRGDRATKTETDTRIG